MADAPSLLSVYLVSFVNGAFNGVTYLDDYFRGIEIAQASIGIALTGNVFYRFADIAYIMTCVEIGNGFMYTLEKQRTSSQKMMRTLGLVGGVVLFILEIVYIGYGGWGWARYYNLYDSRSHSQNSLIGFTTRLDNISFAAIVITLVLFIGTLVQAATVKRTYRSVETSRQVSHSHIHHH